MQLNLLTTRMMMMITINNYFLNIFWTTIYLFENHTKYSGMLTKPPVDQNKIHQKHLKRNHALQDLQLKGGWQECPLDFSLK